MLAVIVDIRLGRLRPGIDAARMFLEPIRRELLNLLNLLSITAEKKDDLSLIVCRTHPDDCERVLTPPFLLHTAYEAVRWIDNRCDSEIIGSSPIDAQRSIENSFKCCADEKLKHIVLFSCDYESETLSTIARCIPKEITFTFHPVCLSSNGETEELREFNFALQTANPMHKVIAVVPCPDIWEYVFSDIRENLLHPTKCLLDLSPLLKNHSKSRADIAVKPILQRLALPQIEKVCACHGYKPDEVDPFNCYKAIQIGSQFFCMNNLENAVPSTDCTPFVAKCFVNVDEVCESKLSGLVYIAWQQQSQESFEALKRVMIRKNLALILDRQQPPNTVTTFTRRYVMVFVNNCENDNDVMQSEFALFRELISVDQNLIGWRMKTLMVPRVVTDETFDLEQRPSFEELSRDFNSVILRSNFHDRMRDIITASSPFRPRKNIP